MEVASSKLSLNQIELFQRSSASARCCAAINKWQSINTNEYDLVTSNGLHVLIAQLECGRNIPLASGTHLMTNRDWAVRIQMGI